MKQNPSIAIIGLGYVGLPLAAAFAEKYNVIGFDINSRRIEQLQQGIDSTLELSSEELKKALVQTENSGLTVTDDASKMAAATVFIVTVPTPTNKYNQPVLIPLQRQVRPLGNY